MIWLLACVAGQDSAEPVSPGDSQPEAVCDTGPRVTWDNWGRDFLVDRCQACHARYAPERYGAPQDVVFDTYEDAERWASRIRERTLVQGDMPPGGGVHADELELLDSWLACELASP